MGKRNRGYENRKNTAHVFHYPCKTRFVIVYAVYSLKFVSAGFWAHREGMQQVVVPLRTNLLYSHTLQNSICFYLFPQFLRSG